MKSFPNYREYVLTAADVMDVIRRFEHHGHCFGFIAERAIDYEKKRRAEEANRRAVCEKSPTGRHEWRFPRAEESIDRKRKLAPIYCELCYITMKPSLQSPPLAKF